MVSKGVENYASKVVEGCLRERYDRLITACNKFLQEIGEGKNEKVGIGQHMLNEFQGLYIPFMALGYEAVNKRSTLYSEYPDTFERVITPMRLSVSEKLQKEAILIGGDCNRVILLLYSPLENKILDSMRNTSDGKTICKEKTCLGSVAASQQSSDIYGEQGRDNTHGYQEKSEYLKSLKGGQVKIKELTEKIGISIGMIYNYIKNNQLKKIGGGITINFNDEAYRVFSNYMEKNMSGSQEKIEQLKGQINNPVKIKDFVRMGISRSSIHMLIKRNDFEKLKSDCVCIDMDDKACGVFSKYLKKKYASSDSAPSPPPYHANVLNDTGDLMSYTQMLGEVKKRGVDEDTLAEILDQHGEEIQKGEDLFSKNGVLGLLPLNTSSKAN